MDSAADIMTSPVVSIDAEATVEAALTKMHAHGVTSLLVIPEDSDDPPGFLSQTDIVAKIIGPGRDPALMAVAKVMSRPVVTVPPETSVQDCARLMHQAHIRRVLVHDGESIVGIVSASDVLGMPPR